MKIKDGMRETIFRIVEKLLDFLIKRTGKISSPISHRFFSEISRHINHVIPYIKLSHKGIYDKGRTEIFRDMLKIKFKIRHNEMKNVIENNCTKDGMMKGIDKLVEEYNKERILSGIPKIVINKFNDWHKEHANILIQAIEDICDGLAFSTEKEKLNAILYMHLNMVIITFRDAEKTLGDLNGELTGLNYKGFILL